MKSTAEAAASEELRAQRMSLSKDLESTWIELRRMRRSAPGQAGVATEEEGDDRVRAAVASVESDVDRLRMVVSLLRIELTCFKVTKLGQSPVRSSTRR